MSMFPHTITLYNVEIIKAPDYNDKVVNHITILKGVLVDASKAVNVRESGLEGADAANLYIPFDVEAVDGVTGELKKYMPPVEFWRAEDKSGLWTLSVSSKNPNVDGDAFFIKGVVVEPDMKTQAIEMKYDDVYDITKIDTKDFGGLKHWEVGAN